MCHDRIALPQTDRILRLPRQWVKGLTRGGRWARRLRFGVLQGVFDDKGVEAGRVLSPIAKNLDSKPKIAPTGEPLVS
jgi:hypothetical protein